MAKEPAFQFYPADWRKDLELQSCSIAARGLWIELICLMHQAKPYGFLTINGKQIDDKTVAKLIGIERKKYQKLLQELIQKGVARLDETGLIYSRRMVEDENIRQVRRKVGLKGGNPAFKKGHRNPYYLDKQKDKQKITPSSSSSSSSSNTSTKKRKNIKKESSDFFDIFWKTHPGTKTGKKKCLEKWKVINPDQVLFDRIIKALQEQTAWRARAKPGEFRPEWKNPLTWLNQECWNDEVGPEKKKEGNYQPYVCGNCNHGFKLNVDLDENCCPNCGMFIRKKQPAKDSPVGKMVGKLADKMSF